MIPDLDIYRSANVLVKQHGQDAPIEAATRRPTGTTTPFTRHTHRGAPRRTPGGLIESGLVLGVPES